MKMKRLMSILLTITMVGVLLTGCGSAKTNSQGEESAVKETKTEVKEEETSNDSEAPI